MEDMRDSTAVPQIVKIVRLVVKFHPLLTVTNLIFGVIFLYDWIEEEVSNQWKILKVYCQSTIRAVLDLIIKKMKNLSRALQMHLNNEVAKGQLKAKVIGKLALFFATFLLLDTEFCSKYDKEGTKTQLLLLFGMGLLTNSKPWSQLGILHGSFKSWLDKYWLDLQQDPSINTTVESTGISMILILVGLHVAQSFIICSAIKSSLSNYKVCNQLCDFPFLVMHILAKKSIITPYKYRRNQRYDFVLASYDRT
ncbi:hypothetical protein SLEP1_g28178 [Rubroshorea leprosula]|uniref:Uncharacterized protein n=1 Tax=Rubroshorea leprosula TaxID=152421 RepID=A0AAV5K3Q8_9ROSI|nr:hypothetical protein SLEP1_g28178 [Rubroshorea leprosula]